MTPAFDSRRVYDVWQKLISDEELYERLLEDRHRELRDSRGLSEEDLAVLDDFRREPGLRWNIQNLRFRAADHVKVVLQVYLPRTLYFLTKGEDGWLRDLVYEYVAYHRWHEYGRSYLTECIRFARYVRERIAQRRRLPEILDPVMALELAVVEVLRETANVPPEAWQRGPAPDDAALRAARPRWGPAMKIIDLPVDFTEWIQTGDPSHGTVKEEPVALLIRVPSLEESHRVQRLSEGTRLLLERCTGSRTTAEIIAEVEDELGLEPAQVTNMIQRWLADGTLRV